MEDEGHEKDVEVRSRSTKVEVTLRSMSRGVELKPLKEEHLLVV